MAHFTPSPQSPVTTSNRGVLSAAASGLDGFITRHGGDLDRVFGRAGIDAEQLQHPTQSLALTNYCQVLEEAARQTGCDHFGLHYGQQFKPQALGLLGYVGLCSATLEQALINFSAAFPYHQHDTLVRLSDAGECYRFEYQVRHEAIGQRRQDAELTLGMAVNLMRHVLGPAWAPREVGFEHARPEQSHVHSRLFDAPVRFDQASNWLLVPKAALAGQVMPGHDPLLLGVVLDAIRQLGQGGMDPDLPDRVRDLIEADLHLGEPDLERLAEHLQLSVRVLQRTLGQYGLSFNALVDQTRQDLAAHHLRTTRLSISELAPLLGYSETSALSRAFRRWYGVSPRQWRQGLN